MGYLCIFSATTQLTRGRKPARWIVPIVTCNCALDLPVGSPRWIRNAELEVASTGELTLTVAPELRSTVLSNDAAHFYDPAGNVVLEPGELDVFVGGGQPAHFAGGVRTTVSVTGAPLPLARCA